MTSPLVLSPPDFNSTFIIEIDASSQDPLLHSKYKWINQQLRKKNKLVIGNCPVLKAKLFKWLHNSPQGGHSGVQATCKRITTLFYWPKLKKTIREYVRECDTYQRCKADLAASSGLLEPLPIAMAIWEDIYMDFIEGLSNSRDVAQLSLIMWLNCMGSQLL
ncbi:ty3-gypsy retrotransposon protein [Tanacetum coccineum]